MFSFLNFCQKSGSVCLIAYKRYAYKKKKNVYQNECQVLKRTCL